MKIRQVIAWTAAMMLTAGGARAVHIWEDPNGWSTGLFAHDEGPRYSAHELAIEGFGSFTAGESKIDNIFRTNIRSGKWGGGVGLNYFFTRTFGIGTDINIGDNGGPAIDHVLGSAILRWPFEPSGWAPYIFGGGGRGIDPRWEWLAHGGAGVEYRFNPTTGIFVDGRYVWSQRSYDRLLLRAGLRMVF